MGDALAVRPGRCRRARRRVAGPSPRRVRGSPAHSGVGRGDRRGRDGAGAVEGSGLVEGAAGLRPHHEEAGRRVPGARSPTPPTTMRGWRRCSTRRTRQIEQAAYGAAWTCADRAADLGADERRGASPARRGARGARARYRGADRVLAGAVARSRRSGDAARGRRLLHQRQGRARPRCAAARARARASGAAGGRIARRRRNAPLAADLAVLEAQALERSRAQRRGARARRRRRCGSRRAAAMRCTRRGVALFDLSRFVDAKTVLQQGADDPARRRVHPPDARADARAARRDARPRMRELRRRVQLAPGELSPPVLISVAEFQKEIDAVVATLPPERRTHVQAIKVEIADLPDPDGPQGGHSRRSRRRSSACIAGRSVAPPVPPGRRVAFDRAVSQEPRSRGEDAAPS